MRLNPGLEAWPRYSTRLRLFVLPHPSFCTHREASSFYHRPISSEIRNLLFLLLCLFKESPVFSLSIHTDQGTMRHPSDVITPIGKHPILSLCLAILLTVPFLHSIATICLYFLLDSEFLQCRPRSIVISWN